MYQKYQLYLDDYQIEDTVVKLPDRCNWMVMKHLGLGHFTDNEQERGGICLILNEPRKKEKGFWPVMSFLTEEEAMRLSKELARYAGG